MMVVIKLYILQQLLVIGSVGLAIWSLSLAKRVSAGNESTVVLSSSSGTTGLLFAFVLLVDLGRLALDLTGTSQRTVNLTTEKLAADGDGRLLVERGKVHWGATYAEGEFFDGCLFLLASKLDERLLGGELDVVQFSSSNENHLDVFFLFCCFYFCKFDLRL